MRRVRLQLAISLACAAACPFACMAQNAPAPAPPKLVEKVTVTADRGLIGIEDSASSVAVLTGDQLRQSAGFALDDVLHAVAGFQLFRRTSSWTANPTTQGVSLRGLGSTAASRTLVVSDQVPLNDPFGGWIHWNELPLLALDHAELLRGGAADLYGSSAIGGAVNLVPVIPDEKNSLRFVADLAGASEDTL
jgi:outer membrane receptor protein involved in Fe transport